MTVKTVYGVEGQQIADTNFGYPAAVCVTVDNYSGSWVDIPATGRLVPPYTIGWVAPTTAPVSLCQAAYAPSPVDGRGPAVAIPPGRTTFTWSSDPQPSSNGVIIYTPPGSGGVMAPGFFGVVAGVDGNLTSSQPLSRCTLVGAQFAGITTVPGPGEWELSLNYSYGVFVIAAGRYLTATEFDAVVTFPPIALAEYFSTGLSLNAETLDQLAIRFSCDDPAASVSGVLQISAPTTN